MFLDIFEALENSGYFWIFLKLSKILKEIFVVFADFEICVKMFLRIFTCSKGILDILEDLENFCEDFTRDFRVS